MNSELGQIILGAIIFGVICSWIISTTNDNISLSPNIEDKIAQYER